MAGKRTLMRTMLSILEETRFRNKAKDTNGKSAFNLTT